MEQTLRSQKGASIVEILIVCVIIGITALIIASFTRSTVSLSKDARNRDAAFMAAEDKLTELAGKPYPASSGSDVVTIDNVECARSWTVKDTSHIKRAVVTVTYTSLQGKIRQINLSGAIN